MTLPTATVLIVCPDRRGLVATFANFIYKHNGNIIHASQHTDFAAGLFLTRIEWQLEGFDLSREEIESAFRAIAQPLQAKWELHFSDTIRRIAIWVSRQDHCLLDLIWRQQSKEFLAQIPLIISNHPNLKHIAEQYGADFQHTPISKDHKFEQEAKQLDLLKHYSGSRCYEVQ